MMISMLCLVLTFTSFMYFSSKCAHGISFNIGLAANHFGMHKYFDWLTEITIYTLRKWITEIIVIIVDFLYNDKQWFNCLLKVITNENKNGVVTLMM